MAVNAPYFTEVTYKRAETEIPTSKSETITLLSEAFDNARKSIEKTPEAGLAETIDFFAGQKSKLQILNLLQDHVTHHRGQIIVYLNLKAIDPPSYSGW